MSNVSLSELDKHLSIVIPVLDSLEYTQQCIDSLSEYAPNAEIIIVNNGSQPDTKQYLDGLKHIKVIHWDVNEGVSKAWNAGLKLATRDVLCVLNNDVTVKENGMQRLTEAAIEVGIAGVSGFCFNLDWTLAYETQNESEADVLGGYCLVFRRDIWNKVGEFDELFTPACWEDNDWCLRARQLDCKWRIINGQINHYCSKTLNRVFDLYTLGNQQRAKFVHKWNIDGIGLGERILIKCSDEHNLKQLRQCVEEIRERKPMAKIQVLTSRFRRNGIPGAVCAARRQFQNYTQEIICTQYLKESLTSFVFWGTSDNQLRNLIKNTHLLKAEYIGLENEYQCAEDAISSIYKKPNGKVKFFINGSLLVDVINKSCDNAP